jgi:RNA polymerase sigma-70 factor, ECF subfamily
MDARNVSRKRQPAEVTDQVLVEQSKQGDPDAMAKLIRRHYGASVRMANSILRNQPDAEDVAQMAYCRAFQKLHTFREEARFSTWITSIVVNLSLLHLRGRRRATLLSLEEPMNERTKLFLTSREPTPEESTARHEIATAISRALAKLPDTLRTPYKLHAISGMPLVEVANELGLSLSATKSRIFRARCTLESRLYVTCGREHHQ